MGNPGRMFIRSGSDDKDLMIKKETVSTPLTVKRAVEDINRSYLLAQLPILALQ